MKRLTIARVQRGWSQSELARRSGLHASTISLAEGGRLRLSRAQLDKLATALDAREPERLLEDIVPS